MNCVECNGYCDDYLCEACNKFMTWLALEEKKQEEAIAEAEQAYKKKSYFYIKIRRVIRHKVN